MNARNSLDALSKYVHNRVASLPPQVDLATLFPNDLVQSYSRFTSLQELFEGYPPMDTAKEDQVKEVLESDGWNRFIAENTRFVSWNEMVADAADRYIGAHFHR